MLQYHPRLVVAAYLQWVLENQAKMPQQFNVPLEVCGHAWHAYIDPAMSHSDIVEVKEAISRGLNSFIALC